MLKKVKKLGIIIIREYLKNMEGGMKRKLVKVLSIVMIIISIISICNTVMAYDGSAVKGAYKGSITGAGNAKTQIKNIIGYVLSAVRIVAVGVAIIVLTSLGVKYMTAAPSEKAGIKNQLIVFTVGAVVAFGAVRIFEIIKEYANAINTVL